MVFGEFGICDVFSEHSQHRLKQAVLLSRRRVVDFLYQRNFPILAMAPMDQPLLAERSKLSMVYGVNEYEEMLRTKMTENSEIAQLKAMSPDQEGPKASAGEAGSVLKSGTEANGKSKKGKREFPTPNKPDPMPRELEFLFTRISPEQMLYMWNVYTALFCAQCACVLAYCFMLSQDVNWYLATAAFGVPMAALMIQNVYILHDVLHGATFPPYDWQKYITHCWADQFSLPWEELVLEHQRHHASTVDLLVHGEFGWDPATWLYVLQEWTDKWYGWLTVPLVPVWHWIGANDTGALFSLLWYANFPDQGAGGKCNKDFWGKWVPNRLRHCLFVASLWTCVWLLGTWPLGRPLSEGWRFFLPVTIACRTGFTIAWTFFTNFNHSHWWNEFLAENPTRSYPVLSRVMAFLLGGKHRFNEMLFHDLHHAFPNAVGALSQRGRFHGWEKVHDAAVDVLSRGLFLPQGEGNQEPPMQKLQKKRSLMKGDVEPKHLNSW